MDGRFVILEHTGHGPRHFDFMLSAGEVLETWQFAENPAELPPDGQASGEQIQDHRLEYLEYEGPVSRDRGHVRQVDAGDYDRHGPHNKLTIQLAGQCCQGRYELARDENGTWRLHRLASHPA